MATHDKHATFAGEDDDPRVQWPTGHRLSEISCVSFSVNTYEQKDKTQSSASLHFLCISLFPLYHLQFCICVSLLFS